MLYLHTASLKSRCFLFILIILVFILDSSLVRQSFLSIWMQMYLKEIQCINKVTLPYLTFHSRESGYRKTETKNKNKNKMENFPVVPALHYVTQTLFFFWLVVQNL